MTLRYFRGCFDSGLTIPVHELLHTLGFVHEHTRPDRDKFITINFDNILPGKKKNFEKRTEGNSDFFEKGDVDSKNTPYDVLSLLHYGPRVSPIFQMAQNDGWCFTFSFFYFI